MSSMYGGVTAAQSWSPTNLQNQSPIPQQVLQPVAKLLGTTPQSLISQMQSGTTLFSIANTQGVSQSDLITAIEQGLQSASPQGATTSQGDLTTLATGIANGTAKIGHHHHHHHHGAAPASSSSSDPTDDDGTDSSSTPTSTVNSLAAMLGLDPNVVSQLLSTGTTVSALASSNGASAELQSLFSTGLQIDTTA